MLLLELARDTQLTVGRLGTCLFPAGWYAYVGSALSGVEQRVARHLRPSPVRHWHIDYLRAVAPVREVWIADTSERRECPLAAELLAMNGGRPVVPRFGASDCHCPAHLIRFEERPDFERLRAIAWASWRVRLHRRDQVGAHPGAVPEAPAELALPHLVQGGIRLEYTTR